LVNHRYGPSTSDSIYVERKTHHADWLDGASVKDRFQIKESKANEFISQKYTAGHITKELKGEETVKNVHFIATGVQDSFQKKKLKPVLRVFYNRTAFQFPDSQLLRISLDTNLTFITEKGHNNWRRNDVGIDYPFEYLLDGDILRFPYAVLETKLQTHLGQEPPAWLTSLVESHLVHEVPRFSKYLHGACYFYKDCLPLVPWWLSEMNVDIKKPRADNIGLSRSRSYKPLIDGRYRRSIIEERERIKNQAMMLKHMPKLQDGIKKTRRSLVLDEKTARALQPSKNKMTTDRFIRHDTDYSGSTLINGERTERYISVFFKRLFGTKNKDSLKELEAQPYKKQVKVEPKTFFANERTFLSWLQFCALLLTVSLNLVNFGDAISRIVGGIFMGLAAIIAIYALYKFERHAW
jgi:hypothetical protein